MSWRKTFDISICTVEVAWYWYESHTTCLKQQRPITDLYSQDTVWLSLCPPLRHCVQSPSGLSWIDLDQKGSDRVRGRSGRPQRIFIHCWLRLLVSCKVSITVEADSRPIAGCTRVERHASGPRAGLLYDASTRATEGGLTSYGIISYLDKTAFRWPPVLPVRHSDTCPRLIGSKLSTCKLLARP